MSADLTPAAKRALRKYGYAVCREAYRLNHEVGEGARTIAIILQVGAVSTTRAADAAINAGRELVTKGGVA